MTADGRRGRQNIRAAHVRTPPVRPVDLAEDRAKALTLVAVSRETLERLDRFAALLLEWQQRINLIAASTEPILWTRHIADCLQLLSLAPDARIWADLGSGAGLPGIVIACALAERAGAQVHLVESNANKCAFLREAVAATGARAIVHNVRAADFVANSTAAIDVVTARALAPLSDLLSTAYPLLIRGALGIFPKGQSVEGELTEAAKCWNIQATLAASRTDPNARIVVVRGLEPASGRARRRIIRDE
jgi:16S rRNA (guanine527-N7)-methyltransferase